MSASTPQEHDHDGPITRPARVSLFGYPPSDAVVELIRRDPFWRGSRAVAFLGGGLVLAPVAALVPPHAPWALGALGLGAILARRKWREHRTLIGLQGSCPRCGAGLHCTRPTRMREPHAITCESCHYEMELSVED